MYVVVYFIFIAVLLFVIALFLLANGYHRLNRYHLILDTPTSKIRALALGLVQVKGNPYHPEFLKTPHSESDCVYYNFKTYEYQIMNPIHPILSRDWNKLAESKDEKAFYVMDGTGYVLVKPEDAEHIVRPKKVLYEPGAGREAKLTFINRIKSWLYGDYKLFKLTDTGFYEFYPHEKIPFKIRVGDRKILETYIGPEDDVYVLGTARHDEHAHNMVVIEKGDEEPTFILSNKPEELLLAENKVEAVFSYRAGAALLVLSIILFLGGLVIA